MGVLGWLPFLISSITAAVQAASLQQLNVTLPKNPTGVGFFIYVPDELPPSPSILVNTHWCHGDASATYAGTTYADLSDEHGFIVIYPDSPNLVDKCWDVASPQTLVHDGGGDSTGIVSMVEWTLDHFQADPQRVFVTGVSSGAMMTNVLLATYPDVFAGGSAFAGVAHGCFGADIPADTSNTVDYWNAKCATGQVRNTPAGWAAMVQAAYPGYDGWRPKVQVFHGTVDEVLDYANLGEEIKQWTGVLGLGLEPAAVALDTPLAHWTKTSYGDSEWLEAYSAWNVTHNIPVQEDVVMDFFDLACAGGDCFRWGQGGP